MRILRYVRIINRMTDEKTSINWRSSAVGILVGAIAAVASFSHMRNLAIDHGQTKLIGSLVPVSVDALIIFATYKLEEGFASKVSAWVGVILGAAASMTANILAAPDDLLSRGISAWPSLALLVVVWVFDSARRKRSKVAAGVAVKTEPAPVDAEPVEAKPRQRNARGVETAQKVAKAAAKKPDAKPSQIAAVLGVSESTVRREIKALNGVQLTPPTPADAPV